jgi:hypothetical protein
MDLSHLAIGGDDPQFIEPSPAVALELNTDQFAPERRADAGQQVGQRERFAAFDSATGAILVTLGSRRCGEQQRDGTADGKTRDANGHPKILSSFTCRFADMGQQDLDSAGAA